MDTETDELNHQDYDWVCLNETINLLQFYSFLVDAMKKRIINNRITQSKVKVKR